MAHWRKIKKARQRLVLCRLMIDVMRTVHGAYAPANERFGTRLETFFIALCIVLGDIDGKPFSVAKIASVWPSISCRAQTSVALRGPTECMRVPNYLLFHWGADAVNPAK